MAKLLKLPDKSIIDGLKGTLDFYVIHLNPTTEEGIAVCRTWPRYDPAKRTLASAATSKLFTYINKLSKTLTTPVVEALRQQASPTRLTWKDVLVRCYLNGEAVYPNSTTLDAWWIPDE